MPCVTPPRQIAPRGGPCAAKRQIALPLVNIPIGMVHRHTGTTQVVVQQVVEESVGTHGYRLPRQHIGGAGVGNGASVAGLLVGGERVVGYRPIGVKGCRPLATRIIAEAGRLGASHHLDQTVFAVISLGNTSAFLYQNPQKCAGVSMHGCFSGFVNFS